MASVDEAGSPLSSTSDSVETPHQTTDNIINESTSHPEYAVICSFFDKFSSTCGIPHPTFAELQDMLENSNEVPQTLIDLHIKLMRKARKTIAVDKWERGLAKFAKTYSEEDSWELERIGYKKSKLVVKLRLLKALLELQFDSNVRFKSEVNKLTAKELRLEPLGKDERGKAYWCQFDPASHIRVYREDLEDDAWKLMARDRQGLVDLINSLSSGEGQAELDLILAEEAAQEPEKPLTDTGQENGEESESQSEDSEEESESESEEESITDKNDVKEINGITEIPTIQAKPEDIFKDSKIIENRTDILNAMSVRFNNVEDLSSPAKKVKTHDDDDLNYIAKLGENVISTTVEEPLIIVEGEGSGAECQAMPEFSEVIEENVIIFSGEGCGADCETGNLGSDETEDEVEQSKLSVEKLATNGKDVEKLENGDDEENDDKSGEASKGKVKDVMLSNIIEVCLDNTSEKMSHRATAVTKGGIYDDLFSDKNIGNVKEKKKLANAKKDFKVESKDSSDSNNCEAKPEKISSRRTTRSNSTSSQETSLNNKISSSSKPEETEVKEDTQVVKYEGITSTGIKKEDNLDAVEVVKEPKIEEEATKEMETLSEEVNNVKTEIRTEDTETSEEVKENKKEPTNDEAIENSSSEEMPARRIRSLRSRSFEEKPIEKKKKSKKRKPDKSDESNENEVKKEKSPNKQNTNEDKQKSEEKGEVSETEKETRSSKNKKKGRPKKSELRDKDKKNEGSYLMGLTERDMMFAKPLEDENSEPGGRVRQSRRIAQLKIKEQAERKALEEATLTMHKEKKKKKKRKDDGDGKKKKKDDTSDDDDEPYEEDKKKKKKKKKKDKLSYNIDKPWLSSSGSSTEEEEEEHDDDFDDEEDVRHKADVSDHEFSPESDLENDEEVIPIKRARTARKRKDPKVELGDDKEKKMEEDESDDNDYKCEKCGTADLPDWILLCDICDKGYHAACLRPPLMLIPEGDWFCPPCQHISLVKKLKEALRTFEKSTKRRENEELRRKRLAYVGISLANVLPEGQSIARKKEKKKKKSVESSSSTGGDDDDDDSDDSDSGSSSSYSEDEPIYQLRQRRAAGQNYRFKDYDELINSAIKDEMEPAENNEQNKTEQTDGNPPGVSEDIKEQEENPEDYVQEEEERPRVVPPKASLGRKKSRKLNCLDINSDDQDSDEDFKGSSDDFEEEESEDLSDDELDFRKAPLRRSNRARQAKIDKDFINDDSDDSDFGPKKKKSRRAWASSESESESDRSWGRRKRKPTVRATVRPKKVGRKPGSFKRKPRKSFDSDSDVPKRGKAKKPKVKYGLPDVSVESSRRTRGKKINFREVIGSDSDIDYPGKPKQKTGSEDDEEFILNEEEQDEIAAVLPAPVKKKKPLESSDEESSENSDEEKVKKAPISETEKSVEAQNVEEKEKMIPKILAAALTGEEGDSVLKVAPPLSVQESVIRGMFQPSPYRPPNHQVPIHRLPNQPPRPRFVDRFGFNQPSPIAGYQQAPTAGPYYPPPAYQPPQPLQATAANEDDYEYQQQPEAPARFPPTAGQGDGEFGGLVSYFSSQHEDDLDT